MDIVVSYKGSEIIQPVQSIANACIEAVEIAHQQILPAEAMDFMAHAVLADLFFCCATVCRSNHCNSLHMCSLKVIMYYSLYTEIS
jgi:hypothetical protein